MYKLLYKLDYKLYEKYKLQYNKYVKVTCDLLTEFSTCNLKFYNSSRMEGAL